MAKSQVTISKLQKGVTLIELVVVLALFMAIVGVTVSIFIVVVNQQRAIIKEQALLNQTSYLTDYLSRTIRMALKDADGTCVTDGQGNDAGNVYLATHPSGGYYQGLTLLTSSGVCQKIYLDENGHLKEVKDNGAPQNILSSDLDIAYVRFIINGDKTIQAATGANASQPRVTFIINIQTTNNGATKDNIIQTTISQINLNL